MLNVEYLYMLYLLINASKVVFLKLFSSCKSFGERSSNIFDIEAVTSLPVLGFNAQARFVKQSIPVRMYL